MNGAALRRVGELPDELVDRRREGELVASERDAGVAVVAGDVPNADAGDAGERLAVEEDQESSDARAELEVVVVHESSDHSPGARFRGARYLASARGSQVHGAAR